MSAAKCRGVRPVFVLCVRIGSGIEEHEEHLAHFDSRPASFAAACKRRHSYQLVPRIHIGTPRRAGLV